jgi:LAS superfamily LD-carboxypeptidase LdcB
MITLEMLTGQSTDHLDSFGKHRLQPEAKMAFLAMQTRAREAGFNLQPASTFRDFERQLAIWNGKFSGQRPVLDHDSRPVNIESLSTEQLCRMILHWSALPGASRHHWGSDLDIYDPDLLPADAKLQLEPWEYLPGGYFSALSEWLTLNMAEFGFYRPFQQSCHGVAMEPWHISYRPIASQLESLLTPSSLKQSWKGKQIAGSDWLIAHLDDIFADFIHRPVS